MIALIEYDTTAELIEKTTGMLVKELSELYDKSDTHTRIKIKLASSGFFEQSESLYEKLRHISEGVPA
jgi:hypothetical protein